MIYMIISHGNTLIDKKRNKMDIKRYIIIQAVKTRENELIPIWDDRIVFEKSKMYGNIIKLKGGYDSGQYSKDVNWL